MSFINLKGCHSLEKNVSALHQGLKFSVEEAPGLHCQTSSYLEPHLPNASAFLKAELFETKVCNVPWATLNRKMPLALLLSREKVDKAQQRL